MNNIVVYCGSNLGETPLYVEVARGLGEAIAERGSRLVYGGGRIGLMGTVADAVLQAGGEVVGVTNMKISGGEGLGFAIPVSYLKHFLNNRDAFAFDQNNPNTGFRYLEAPRRRNPDQPPPAE